MKSLLVSMVLAGLSLVSSSSAQAGGWKGNGGGLFIADHAYRLKAGISVRYAFDAWSTINGDPLVYYMKSGLISGKNSLNTPIEGCIGNIVTDGAGNLRSFEFRSAVPDFVSKSLNHGLRPLSLKAVTKITPYGGARDSTTSRIDLLDETGVVVETFHNQENDSGLYLRADEYLEARQCAAQ